MQPLIDLLDGVTEVHFSYRGHDYEEDKVITPLFIEVRKNADAALLSVNFHELQAMLNSGNQDFTLSDLDYPETKIRIRQRLKHLYEDGGMIYHLELTVRNKEQIKQALVIESHWHACLNHYGETISRKMPSSLAA